MTKTSAQGRTEETGWGMSGPESAARTETAAEAWQRGYVEGRQRGYAQAKHDFAETLIRAVEAETTGVGGRVKRRGGDYTIVLGSVEEFRAAVIAEIRRFASDRKGMLPKLHPMRGKP